MSTSDEQGITEAILRSDLREHLLLVRLDPDQAGASARFRTKAGDSFTVVADTTQDESPDSIATLLISLARARLATHG